MTPARVFLVATEVLGTDTRRGGGDVAYSRYDHQRVDQTELFIWNYVCALKYSAAIGGSA
jgi:hypothetical protein